MRHPGKEVVFFAVGFETTAAANALAVYQARQQGLRNFSVLVSHVLGSSRHAGDPWVTQRPGARVSWRRAMFAPMMGCAEYHALARRSPRLPIVVTGFEPVDILQGILMCVQQLGQRPDRGREPICPGCAAPRAISPAQQPHAGSLSV